MSLPAFLKDPEALDARLNAFAAAPEDMESGKSFLSYVNGLITAAAVGPVHIPATEWMARAVDFTDGAFDAETSRLALAMLLFEHSKIVKSLKSRVNGYEPFFWEDRAGRLVTRDWVEGFMAGMHLREEAWEPLKQGEARMLLPLLAALSQDESVDAKMVEMGFDPREIFAAAQAELPGLIWALYDIRREQPVDLGGFGRAEPKIGRNEPCPCGSGKKYKKCCLN